MLAAELIDGLLVGTSQDYVGPLTVQLLLLLLATTFSMRSVVITTSSAIRYSVRSPARSPLGEEARRVRDDPCPEKPSENGL